MRQKESIWKESGDAILPLLKAVSSGADVFPPLKGAVGLVLIIGETAVVRCIILVEIIS